MNADHTEDDENDVSVTMYNVAENKTLLHKNYNVTRELPKVRFPLCRLVLIFMGFLGFLNVYTLRVNLSIALVAMMNHTQHASLSHHGNNSDICVTRESVREFHMGKDGVKLGEFNWDSHTQGAVLAAFFYGYIVTQV